MGSTGLASPSRIAASSTTTRREFWAALGRLLPDYEARRERLRTEGPRFIW